MLLVPGVRASAPADEGLVAAPPPPQEASNVAHAATNAMENFEGRLRSAARVTIFPLFWDPQVRIRKKLAGYKRLLKRNLQLLASEMMAHASMVFALAGRCLPAQFPAAMRASLTGTFPRQPRSG
jgi:hypothetical protein